MFGNSLTLGPDGNFWFTATRYDGPQRAVVGTTRSSGAVSEYPVPPFPAPPSSGAPPTATAITTGADGDLWFGASIGRRKFIGRATTDGQITEFPLPRSRTGPTALTPGPDGNIWFAVESAGVIGRISPSGEVAEFSLEHDSRPRGIVAGEDGALWFTEYGTDRIGRIGTDGQVDEIQLHLGTARPNRIAVGHAGDLWFDEAPEPGARGYSPRLADHLGRIAMDGTVTLYRAPMRAGGAGPIVAGPEGKIWYSTSSGPNSDLGWIGPDGRTGLLAPTGSYANSLAVGPEGALWFTLDVAYNNGGGGSGLINLMEPGHIARYDPPPLLAATGVPPVHGGRTSVALECLASSPCQGTLALSGDHHGDAERWASGGYDLAPGEAGSASLTLTRLGTSRLRAEHKLPVSLKATPTDGGPEEFLQRVRLTLGR